MLSIIIIQKIKRHPVIRPLVINVPLVAMLSIIIIKVIKHRQVIRPLVNIIPLVVMLSIIIIKVKASSWSSALVIIVPLLLMLSIILVKVIKHRQGHSPSCHHRPSSGHAFHHHH